MAVFYVLPPRTALGECLARLLRPYLPGISIATESCSEMVEALANEAALEDEAYVIHREDLPDDGDVDAALRHGFGAEPGDQVVLVSLGAKPDQPTVQLSRVAA